MKIFYTLLVAVIGLASFGPLQAKMTPETFNTQESVTSGKLFLNQVDTVSLYLTTERIVYVPRISYDLHLNVSLTLLGMSFGSDPAELEKFVTRHINSFNKTLKDRLEFYAPKLSKEFDPKQDVDFEIKLGADQKTVATWQGGNWKWLEKPSQKPVSKILQQQGSVQEGGTCKKKCPAMIGVAEPQS